MMELTRTGPSAARPKTFGFSDKWLSLFFFFFSFTRLVSKCVWWISDTRGFALISLVFWDGWMFIQRFKGGAGRNYHLQDKSLPTTPPARSRNRSAPHFHNILDRGEVMLSKWWWEIGKWFWHLYVTCRKWLMQRKRGFATVKRGRNHGDLKQIQCLNHSWERKTQLRF